VKKGAWRLNVGLKIKAEIYFIPKFFEKFALCPGKVDLRDTSPVDFLNW
jgi:hypothetical protein